MCIDPSLFDSDSALGESSSESSDEEDPAIYEYYSNLSMEDYFLLVSMKLTLGLSTIDSAVRFNVSEATVTKLVTTWIINYLKVYVSTVI